MTMWHSCSRRGFLDRVTDGLFAASLLTLLQQESARHQVRAAEQSPATGVQLPDTRPKQPHFPATAKAVIQLCMQGGPSQVDLFDPKPALNTYDGQPPPREITAGAVFENDRQGSLMQSPFKFSQHGECGAWVSELLPYTAQHVDEMTIIRSMYNVHPNHEPAIFKWLSGETFPGHPVFGSWITYGLGSENQNLPAYVVLADPTSRLPTNGVECWMSGYLPPLYQGTRMRTTGSPLLNLQADYDEPEQIRDAKRDFIAALDQRHRSLRPRQPVLDARIANYEMAARMQLEAARTLNLAEETPATLEMYGIGQKQTDAFGRQCLLARRLIEHGVRFVQLFPRGQAWDNHRNLGTSLPDICRKTDKPVAGLLTDLNRRGLLDSTLILWGGEFGRLPMAQTQTKSGPNVAGRDHGPYGFTSWMAGGGVKRGFVFGSTDDVGYAAVENRVSIQDWHATILHLLGLYYEDLTVDRNGLEEKLTHQHETRVVTEILA